jgi:predicted membrane-bound spermidine synthase
MAEIPSSASGIPRWRRAHYGAAVFLSAAGALVIEIVAGRLLAPYIGMSLYSWTAIIAVVLAGLSIGHWIGGRLAGPAVDNVRGTRRVAAALALAALSSLASLVLLRLVARPLLESGVGAIPSIVVLATLLFLLPSLFVGIVSPILTKLAIDAAPGDPGRVIGRMYALGTVGSIVGTLAAGYIFISWIGSTGTVISVAAIYALLAIGFSLKLRDSVTAFSILLVAGGGFGVAVATMGAHRSPCLAESDYYCLRIDDFSAVSGRPSAVIVIDHLGQGINDRDDPTLLYSPYIHFVDELAKRRFPGPGVPETFFIGGGGYTLPRAWAVDDPRTRLLVAEIDPTVTLLARNHMWLSAIDSLQIVHDDARAALQRLPPEPRFNMVFLDAFHDITMPAHLVTREFHAAVAMRLKPGGFYAINVVEGGAKPVFLFSLVHTLRQIFPTVTVWAEADEAGLAGRDTYVVIAETGPVPQSPLVARRGFDRIWQRWPSADLAARIAAADPPILTDDLAPVDRLMAHVLLAPALAER